jgi:hypothetical protein
VPPCPCAAHDRRYFQGSRVPPPSAVSTTNSTLFHPARVLLGLMVAVALHEQVVEQVRAVRSKDLQQQIPCGKLVLESRDAVLVGFCGFISTLCDTTRAHRVITAWPPLLSPRNFVRVTRVSRCLQVLSLSTARPGMRASYLGGAIHRHAPLCLIPPMHSVMWTDCGCPCPAGLGGWVGVCGVCMCVFHWDDASPAPIDMPATHFDLFSTTHFVLCDAAHAHA